MWMETGNLSLLYTSVSGGNISLGLVVQNFSTSDSTLIFGLVLLETMQELGPKQWHSVIFI